MSDYKTEGINSITEFVDLVERIKEENEDKGNDADLLFRGQREDKPLLPRLARLKLNGKINNIENLMIEEFKKGILPLSEFKPEDDWDYLALAQHHGLPTRLLDWTFSALTSLWFAVCKSPEKDYKRKYKSGVVWILSADVKDFNLSTKSTGPFDNSVTKIYRPKVVSRRISAQAGAFTVHHIDKDGKFTRFESHEEFKHKLTKVKIDGNNFAKIRDSLYTLGINHFTLFPDLDGFCKLLQWRFSRFEDELNDKSSTYYGPAIGLELLKEQIKKNPDSLIPN
jgi:hypothetical protein